MGFGLGHGRDLDDALGTIGVSEQELPPLPDSAATDPHAGLLDPRAWFANPAAPFEIEIGCGKGTFLLETARANLATNFLGIEWAREFYLYTSDRVRRAALTNVRTLRTDGADFFRWRCVSSLASVIHLYFSDPWPKTKHHKNRVVQHRFLAECWRILTPGGELRIITDHDDLWEWDQAHFKVWTEPATYASFLAGELAPGPEHQPSPPLTILPHPPVGSRGETSNWAPYTTSAFIPPPWVGEGQLVGTNYERKFAIDQRPAHSVVLRKPR